MHRRSMSQHWRLGSHCSTRLVWTLASTICWLLSVLMKSAAREERSARCRVNVGIHCLRVDGRGYTSGGRRQRISLWSAVEPAFPKLTDFKINECTCNMYVYPGGMVCAFPALFTDIRGKSATFAHQTTRKLRVMHIVAPPLCAQQ